MKNPISLLLLLGTTLLLTATTAFSYNATFAGGVKVHYSLPGARATFDGNDNTVTIEVTQSGGSLTVTVPRSAAFNWGSQVDVYILAADAIIPNLKLIGSPACNVHVVGQCYYVRNFTMIQGVVGQARSYSSDFGLGMRSSSKIASVRMTQSWTTAPLGGITYASRPVAPSGNQSKNFGPLPIKQVTVIKP